MGLAARQISPVAPDPAHTLCLSDLEADLHETLVRFADLSGAWPKARTPLDRARIGEAHETALERIGMLRNQIARLPARGLDDVAVKLRRLLVVVEGPEAESLLATALDGLEIIQSA